MTNPYPPKTARWWFAEYLPEPYRGQAIANAPKNSSELSKSVYHSLDHFTWMDTPDDQGFDYWADIQKRALEGEFDSENPDRPKVSPKKLPLHLPDEMREAEKYLRVKMGMDKLPGQIQSATESFAGVDTDAFMNEVRGRDNLNTYTIQTTQFSATVIAADQQGAMDILFKYMLNCAAFTFRFDRGNIVAGSSDVPEGAKAGILEYEKL